MTLPHTCSEWHGPDFGVTRTLCLFAADNAIYQWWATTGRITHQTQKTARFSQIHSGQLGVMRVCLSGVV